MYSHLKHAGFFGLGFGCGAVFRRPNVLLENRAICFLIGAGILQQAV
ncbi:hypothetical protein [Neisseria sp. WF04]|nr:hypothetical protein [Neisseria sp. WF04]